MGTTTISLPSELKAYVDEHAAEAGYSDGSAYVSDLIRKEQGRQRFRNLILDGLNSGPAEPMDENYFDELRASIRAKARK